ncbi:potassium-transporting ATPase subunit C [Enterococcus sp. ALS3]|uniref:Potassium-transporting ATPase KdpC subunit n=1 Tax=Enterococcus alishanensis TaxID=1303817 RepID=A0ABS6TGM3_9ENTE|nr:potassium-transporting ATPase subunit C [Enterococcus alishanensis]MBV7392036.1 potassium-transporting ATPase subunit C [Enterococcus alishanensis]
MSKIFSSLRFLLFAVILFGGLYTLLVTGIGQLFFNHQANGSSVTREEQVVGSSLVGQDFFETKYFSGRSSDVSQLSPISKEQADHVRQRKEKLLAENPTETQVPNDLVTASASGVDPDISLAAANFQVERIAKARQINPQKIHAIINETAEKDWFSSREFVNVLQLNLALDELI